MVDPRRYSSDPWQRELGRLADQNKERARQNDTNPSKSRKQSSPSSNSNSNNIDPEAAAAGMALVIMGFVAIAVLAAEITKLTHKEIRGYLNKKDGLDQQSTKNNLKAGWLTAGFFCVSSALITGTVSIVNAYNEAQRRAYPEVVVAFNRGIRAFAYSGLHNDLSEYAIGECRRNSSSSFFACQVRARVEAGTPMCVDYGGVASFRLTTDLRGMPTSKLSNVDYFVQYVDNKNLPNQATEQCLRTGRYESQDCTNRTYFQRVCNFN